MNKLLIDNYRAVVKRGLINPKTTSKEFWSKLQEEFDECHLPYLARNKEELSKELTDVICVCTNWIIHMGFDPETLLKQNAKKNYKRAQISSVGKRKSKLNTNMLKRALETNLTTLK